MDCRLGFLRSCFFCLTVASIGTINAQSKNDLRLEIDRLRQDSSLQEREYINLYNTHERLLIENESTNRRLYFSDSLLVSRSSEIVNLNQTISLVQNSSSVLISNLEERISILERTNDSLRSLLEELYSSEPDTINWYVDGLDLYHGVPAYIKLYDPDHVFSKPQSHYLLSKDGKVKIECEENFTFWNRDCKPCFVSSKDVVQYYSQHLIEINHSQTLQYKNYLNQWVEPFAEDPDYGGSYKILLKGTSKQDNLICYFGFFHYSTSCFGCPTGSEPLSFYLSESTLLKVTADNQDIKQFNLIVNYIQNHFDRGSIVLLDL